MSGLKKDGRGWLLHVRDLCAFACSLLNEKIRRERERHTYTYVYMYVCIHVWYVCMHVYIVVYIYIRMHIYTHIVLRIGVCRHRWRKFETSLFTKAPGSAVLRFRTFDFLDYGFRYALLLEFCVFIMFF